MTVLFKQHHDHHYMNMLTHVPKGYKYTKPHQLESLFKNIKLDCRRVYSVDNIIPWLTGMSNTEVGQTLNTSAEVDLEKQVRLY